jgi:oligopeptide transport system ATP-binding protein
MSQALLELVDLKKHYKASSSIFSSSSAVVQAVDGVSFSISPETTFSLVGESGCGKTTITKVILLLESPTAGVVLFRGRPVHELAGKDLKEYKRSVQSVSQDPAASMNPRMRVRDIIGEPLRVHQGLRGRALMQRVEELLNDVGLSPAVALSYPHQFSGGQRQRISIARALALKPELIVLDEPVSGLDVSIRAQVLNLLADLQERNGLSYLLVSHDLAIVEHMSHSIGVMYLGRLAELSEKREFFAKPLHPYSRALMDAVPQPDPDIAMGDIIVGDVPSPINPPSGCRFHTRCPYYGQTPICREEQPPMVEYRPAHLAACHKTGPDGLDPTLAGAATEASVAERWT